MTEYAIAAFDATVGPPKSDSLATFCRGMSQFAESIGTSALVLVAPRPNSTGPDDQTWRLFFVIDLGERSAIDTTTKWLEFIAADNRLKAAPGDTKPVGIFNDTSVFEVAVLMARTMLERRILAGLCIPECWFKDPRAGRFLRMFDVGQGMNPKMLRQMAEVLGEVADHIDAETGEPDQKDWLGTNMAAQPKVKPKSRIVDHDDIAASGDSRDPRELGY